MRQTKYTCDGCQTIEMHDINSEPPSGWAVITIAVQGFAGWKYSTPRNIGTQREFCEACQLSFSHDINAALSAERGKAAS